MGARRWLKLAAAFAVAGPVGIAGLQAYRAWVRGNRDFDNVPMKFELPRPLEGHEAITLKTKGGLSIAASFVPSKTGVAVVLTHGTDTGRIQVWPEVETLAKAGIGCVAFDMPGHGESEGTITLGTPEREAFTAAVDFLSARPEVRRIGAFGFSMGGGLLTTFSADEPRVKSLLTVGAWTDPLTQTKYEYRRWGPIQAVPAALAAEAHIEGGKISALAVAGRLKGRKTMFVAGLEDRTVPPWMSAELAGAAGGAVKLIPHAGHTDFREVWREWPKVLVEFFATE